MLRAAGGKDKYYTSCILQVCICLELLFHMVQIVTIILKLYAAFCFNDPYQLFLQELDNKFRVLSIYENAFSITYAHTTLFGYIFQQSNQEILFHTFVETGGTIVMFFS